MNNNMKLIPPWTDPVWWWPRDLNWPTSCHCTIILYCLFIPFTVNCLSWWSHVIFC